MAVTNLVSDQLTEIELLPSGKPDQFLQRPIRQYFSINTGLVAGDATSVWRLFKVPKGSRLLGGHIAAVICGAAGATLALGVTGTAAKYMAATAIDSALNADFGHTPALNFGEVLAADTEVIGTIAGAATLTSKAVAGYVDYFLP